MRALLVRLALLLSPLFAAPAALAQYAEAEVKAAFVFNVAKFAEWPAEALPPGAPLRVCVLGGAGPFGVALAALEGKAVREHVLTVQLEVRAPSSRSCQLLVAPADAPEQKRLLVAPADAPEQKRLLVAPADAPEQKRLLVAQKGMLTIGDGEGFVDAGGMIGIGIVSSRVQFEVNLDAAREGGIRLPAQLLRLARRVKGQ